MADSKLTALTELTNPADGDLLYIVDVSAPNVGKKVSMTTFLTETGAIKPRVSGTQTLGADAETWGDIWGKSARFMAIRSGGHTLTAGSQVIGFTDTATGTGTAVDLTIGAEGTVIGSSLTAGAGSTQNMHASGAPSLLVGCDVESTPLTAQTQQFKATGRGTVIMAKMLSFITASTQQTLASGVASKIFAINETGVAAGTADVLAAGESSTIFGHAEAQSAFGVALKTTSGSVGAFLSGHAQAGQIEIGGNGAGGGGHIDAAAAADRVLINGDGSFGWVDNTGSANCDCTGDGSQIWGQNTGAVNLICSANNATQWGPGTNRNIDTGQWGVEGTGIAVKGTAGAFANVADGQIRNNAGVVELRSNGVDIKLAQSAAYTPSNVTTDRTYDANATNIAELADIVGTLIADLQATGLIA